jgi:putative Ca2+/H+ antiporter (TMEM165/GDT1 family)
LAFEAVQKRPSVNLAVVAAVFPVIFLGELPDKTMFASLVMATRARPLAAWLGATAAFAVHVVIATTVGALLLDILPHRAAELAVALTFFAGTGFMLDDLAARNHWLRPRQRGPDHHRHGCPGGLRRLGCPGLSGVLYAQGA